MVNHEQYRKSALSRKDNNYPFRGCGGGGGRGEGQNRIDPSYCALRHVLWVENNRGQTVKTTVMELIDARN